MLPFSEKVKDTDLIKKSNAEVAKICNNKSSTQEIVKKEKNCQFAVAPQTTILMAAVCGKCLGKMEKALTLYNMIF